MQRDVSIFDTVWLFCDSLEIALVVCRAFTTSQSAEAHRELFMRIFKIAESDTNRPLRLNYIHGAGIEVIVADSHKGQAIGKIQEMNDGFTNRSNIQV